jgi:hypothetical protein
MFSWWGRWRKQGSIDRYNRGYEYVASELLRGTGEDLLWDQVCDPFDPNEFEMGMKDALIAWGKLKVSNNV